MTPNVTDGLVNNFIFSRFLNVSQKGHHIAAGGDVGSGMLWHVEFMDGTMSHPCHRDYARHRDYVRYRDYIRHRSVQPSSGAVINGGMVPLFAMSADATVFS